MSPRDVVRLAWKNGVRVQALTDHDTLAGLDEAAEESSTIGIRLIRGVEISASWGADHSIHVVGLRVDPNNAALAQGLGAIRAGRSLRASEMAEGLARAGIPDTLDAALAYAGNPDVVGRAHFARVLVDRGVASNVSAVFKRFLVKGKPGFVRHQWATVAEAVHWIRQSGGDAVLAHPGRYPIGKAQLLRLIDEFIDAGGNGIEVVTSNHSRDETDYFTGIALRKNLKASLGSDFHGPGESYLEPGQLPPLSESLTPIWADWPQEIVSGLTLASAA